MNFFISFCNKKSAIYNSYRGIEFVLNKAGMDSCFFMPGDQNKDTDFFYSLKHPLLTIRSLYDLAQIHGKKIKDRDNLIIFNQGFFGLIFLLFLRFNGVKPNVVQWVHEPLQFSRVGYLRGIYYFFSDFIISFFVDKAIVSSKELVPIARRLYKNKIFVVDLPMSYDFALFDSDLIEEKKSYNDINILFFGGISGYKNLDELAKVAEPFLKEGSPLSITVVGVGDLQLKFPLMNDLCARFETVFYKDQYLEAADIVSYIKKSTALYVNYTSVTATSQIDIANYFGLPVIVSDLPYFRGKVKDGVNGWIIKTEGDLKKLLKNLLCNDSSVKLSRSEVKKYNEAYGADSRFKKDFYAALID